MKKSLIILLILIMRTNSFPQINEKSYLDFLLDLNSHYSKIKIKQIQTKRFDLSLYHQILDSLIRESDGIFTSEVIGKSFKKQEIKLIRFGNGVIKILMWSQMHGDESTASMALLDMINYMIQNKEFTENIKKRVSLYIIPILNPDGAKKFERRNYQEIDINRDALRLQTPEGKLLKKIFDEVKPAFAFNLHDQYSNYSVGKTGKPAAIALLAPAFDYERNINETRKKAIQICVEIKDIIEKFYPRVIARYDDEFEPRAFGDNIQKWGSSTILIESGGYFNDFEKQEIRKMNFLALLGSIYSIAFNLYHTKSIDEYFAIPENERRFFDLLIQNVIVEKDSVEYLVDIGITYSEKFDSLRNRYIREYSVTDIGDLSTFFSFDTLDAKNLKLEFGKVYENVLTDYAQLRKLRPEELLKRGYTTIIYQGNFQNIEENSLLDLMINTTKYPLRETRSLLGHSANFVLRDKEGILRYIIVNGKVMRFEN